MDKTDIDLAVGIALDLGPDRGRRLLQALGAAAALREFTRACATAYAVELLTRRVPRLEIRDRLMVAYGLKMRSAYRAVDRALTIFCQHSPDSGKQRAEDEASIPTRIGGEL